MMDESYHWIADLPFLSSDVDLDQCRLKSLVQITYGEFHFSPVCKEHSWNVHMVQRASCFSASSAWTISWVSWQFMPRVEKKLRAIILLRFIAQVHSPHFKVPESAQELISDKVNEIC